MGDKGDQEKDAWGASLGCSEQAEEGEPREQVLRVIGTWVSGEGVRVPQQDTARQRCVRGVR